MPKCGIEKLAVAKLLSDTSSGLTYDTPSILINVKQIDIKPKTEVASGYGDNRKIDQMAAFDSADVSINRYAMTNAERALILGQSTAAAGGVIASAGDEAPFIAILYKSPIRTNSGTIAYRYGVIFKAVFTPPDDSMKGLEGKPDLSQTDNITGSAQTTDWSFTDNTTIKHPWEYHVDTTDPSCPVDIDSTWFAAVVVPGADAVAPTVTTVPLDAATGVAIGASIVYTFSKAINPADMTGANFFLLKSGVPVACGLTANAGYTVITMKPTANMSAGAHVAICTTNVRSASGVPLAANKITNFTV